MLFLLTFNCPENGALRNPFFSPSNALAVAIMQLFR